MWICILNVIFGMGNAMLACLLVVVGRFRPWRCTAGVSDLRSAAMATKMTAETEVWSTDSATLGTCRPGWSCLRSCMSTSSVIAGYFLRGFWEIFQSSSTRRSPWFSVSWNAIHNTLHPYFIWAKYLCVWGWMMMMMMVLMLTMMTIDKKINEFSVSGCAALFNFPSTKEPLHLV